MSAGTRLECALLASARAAGCAVAVSAASERPWASATFVGSRHVLTLDTPPSSALTEWLASLRRTELRLPGHLVAEMIVTRNPAGVTLSALTLET